MNTVGYYRPNEFLRRTVGQSFHVSYPIHPYARSTRFMRSRGKIRARQVRGMFDNVTFIYIGLDKIATMLYPIVSDQIPRPNPPTRNAKDGRIRTTGVARHGVPMRLAVARY
jgi:hypothetical protein